VKTVLVIGGGLSGLAAAYAARRAAPEVNVVLVTGRLGATEFSPGALDDTPWDELERAEAVLSSVGARVDDAPERELEAELRGLLDALGLFAPASTGRPLLATSGGVLRRCRVAPKTALDLRTCGDRLVLLPDLDRQGWDATSLARSLAADPRAPALQVASALALRFSDEALIADVDLARRHDDPARVEWLGRELLRAKERAGRAVAFLLGPWLGVETDAAERLTSAIGCPVGEIVAAHAGTFGARFRAARTLLAEREGIDLVDGEATELLHRRDVLEVIVEEAVHPADRVVLATGGVAGGGVVYRPPLVDATADGALHIAPSFTLSLRADVPLGPPHRRALAGSSEGPVLDQTAWPSGSNQGALERVGLVVDAGHRVLGSERVFAAGDLVAERPRTTLVAAASGLAAGAAAARACSR
jgi:glycerol-3-phosphate dehydrogenase subunit B